MSETLRSIQAGDLQVAYQESGPADGPPVILLHGFPYDVHCFDQVSAQLSSRGLRCIAPYLRGYGPTRFLSAQTMRSGQQAALGADLLALMNALEIPSAVLAGYDWGGRAACIVAALWPDRVSGLVSGGSSYNIQNIANAARPASPDTEHRFWYQYYFHSERGRRGLTEDRHALCRFIWKLWSPNWAFSDQTYEQTANAFENPDFIGVVIHSYRHRFGGIAGDPGVQEIETLLASQPVIQVPTFGLHGADDQVDPATDNDPCRHQFSGPYQRELIAKVGHNVPQEAPDKFAAAIVALLS